MLGLMATGEEVDLLPPRGGLVGERGGGQQCTAGGPEATDVRAGVGRALVEPDSEDVRGDVGSELDPDLEVGLSVSLGVPGTVALLQREIGPDVETETPADGVSRLPLSSTARLLIVTDPSPLGTQV